MPTDPISAAIDHLLSVPEGTPVRVARAVSLLAGAAYALGEAARLNYRGSAPPSGRHHRNKRVLRALREATNPPAEWLAGYHFNDAIIRLHIAGERAGLLRTLKKNRLEPHELRGLRDDGNRLKHGEERPRNIRTIERAVECLAYIAQSLAKRGVP